MQRIALLVDSLHVSKYVRDLVDWAEGRDDLCVCALIVHEAPQSSLSGFAKLLYLIESQGLYTALSRILFSLVSRIEVKLFLRHSRFRDYRGSFYIGDRVKEHLRLSPQVSKSGYVYRFTKEQVARVRALSADLLVRCGNGIMKGDILSSSRCGVLSMHHGDNRVNRGGPAAFWEVLERHPSTGFIVQRLTEELDGGEVLFRGSIPTGIVYSLNHAELLERSNTYLMNTIVEVLDGRAIAEDPFVYDRRLHRTPLAFNTLRYCAKTLMLLTGKTLRKMLGFRWRWGVAYLIGDWRNAILWRGRKLVNPPGRFLADPFPVITEQGRFLFVEDYSFASGKGVISVYRIHEDGSNTALGLALEEPFHLSFPFTFEHESNIYMCPETSAAGQIRLYRCTNFPLKWELESVLIDGVEAADTMLFEKDGRWWMLTTIAPAGSLENASELCLFYADDPRSTNWTRHSGNPVVMDAARGRNGGLLRDGDTLYRVAQQRGFGRYGVGMAIYRVDAINEREYRETPVQNLRPLFYPGLGGTHHLQQGGNLVAFDYVRNSRTRKAGD